MGIGVTGYLQATDEQKGWLSNCYEYLREFDRNYSRKHGFPTSIKLATTKPSGTLSLLAGVTSGVHPGFARYCIRRIRIASESTLIDLARRHKYPVEYVRNFDGTNDITTMVISFPYSLPEGTIFAKNCSAIEQMEWVKKLQTEWSDNSVSVTVYYKKEELPEIKEWLRKNYNNSIKTISFLLFSEHGFEQAPFEEITKEQYEEMVKKCKPITSVEGVCYHVEDEKFIGEGECKGGKCPLR
jgi:ribonucleoside-diphosphate reductase alpha chain